MKCSLISLDWIQCDIVRQMEFNERKIAPCRKCTTHVQKTNIRACTISNVVEKIIFAVLLFAKTAYFTILYILRQTLSVDQLVYTQHCQIKDLSVHTYSMIGQDNPWTVHGQTELSETVCVLLKYQSATGQ